MDNIEAYKRLVKEQDKTIELLKKRINELEQTGQYPWKKPPLLGWRICGMNHYELEGKTQLFVSMTKGNLCIKQEGTDSWIIWNNLSLMADYIEPPNNG